MLSFKDILGQDLIKKHFITAIATGNVSHAYILSGEEGMGKKTMANAFALSLMCEEGKSGEPCRECHACRQVLSGNHPDIIYVTHEKPNSIGIEDIREQLIGDVAIKPYIGPHKIYIVDEAEKMTVQAQNALLKTIEEPPAYAVILLLVNNGGSLLPTISSRCVTLNFKPVRDEVIRQYLMEELHVPDYQAEISVAFAQGNVGKAKQIATAEDFSQMMESALRILKKSKDMEVYEMVDAIKTLSEEKHTIYEYLDLFLVWFRDVLMFKATHEIDGLVFRQEYKDIKSRADKSSYEGLENIIKAIENAKVRLQANVNFELTMELLFLTIREN